MCQASIEGCLYMLIGDLFAPQYRQRAYIGYGFIGLLYEPMKFGIAELIFLFGWKVTWHIIGGINIGLGLIFILTVFEPKNLG